MPTKRKHRTPGIIWRDGSWWIEKQILGRRIRRSCYTVDEAEAEHVLAVAVEEVRRAKLYGDRPRRIFREAATRYLREIQHKSSAGELALLLKTLDGWIGDLPLTDVHSGTLEPFVQHCIGRRLKNKTINSYLSVVRRVLNLAASSWRDESGLTWIANPPKLEMRDTRDSRPPQPISWGEQAALLNKAPAHLQDAIVFAVNTGLREHAQAELRWEWEVAVPEVGATVFLVPPGMQKNGQPHVVVLNAAAREVIERRRGIHPERVFTWGEKNPRPMTRFDNSGWRRCREKAGLAHVRWHDLRHTFGRRLRAAGVTIETRRALLGHSTGSITSHYSAAELQELIGAAERALERRDGLLVQSLARKMAPTISPSEETAGTVVSL